MVFNQGKGKYFWSNGYQYGTIEIKDDGSSKKVTLHSVNGDLPLHEFSLSGYGRHNVKPGLIKKGEPLTFAVTNNDRKAGLPQNEKLR